MTANFRPGPGTEAALAHWRSEAIGVHAMDIVIQAVGSLSWFLAAAAAFLAVCALEGSSA